MSRGLLLCCSWFFFFQAEDGIRDWSVTGVQTCALPICCGRKAAIAQPLSWATLALCNEQLGGNAVVEWLGLDLYKSPPPCSARSLRTRPRTCQSFSYANRVPVEFGTKQTCRSLNRMSAFGGKADKRRGMALTPLVASDPKRTRVCPLLLRCTALTCYTRHSPWAGSSRCSGASSLACSAAPLPRPLHWRHEKTDWEKNHARDRSCF